MLGDRLPVHVELIGTKRNFESASMRRAFCSPSPLPASRTTSRRSTCPTTRRRRTAHPPQCSTERDLYADLGLPGGDATLSHASLKEAYRAAARRAHPDGLPDTVSTDDDDEFARAAAAWAVLGDATRRSTYDAVGWAGITALDSIATRSAQARTLGITSGGPEAEMLVESGDLEPGLLEPAALAADRPAGSADDDACPRSVDEALWNIEFHEDHSVRYYGLWWVYRFKVSVAEPALVRILRGEVSAALRRRAALALGSVAAAPGGVDDSGASEALADALASGDYYLRYRAAEALANVARRHAGAGCEFPPGVMRALRRILESGRERLARKKAAATGFSMQEGLFDLEHLEPAVREKIAAIFEGRRENEKRARRTTMTPQLGVDEVDASVDEPFEWVLKAAGAIAALEGRSTSPELVEVIRFYAGHDIPLVRYAAHKALYALTGDATHAETLVGALGYGVEHHYSQRVLCRDLGDLGYAKGARAVAKSPMVENSFKVLALKNMLGKHANDVRREEVRDVLRHMDSLL